MTYLKENDWFENAKKYFYVIYSLILSDYLLNPRKASNRLPTTVRLRIIKTKY